MIWFDGQGKWSLGRFLTFWRGPSQSVMKVEVFSRRHEARSELQGLHSIVCKQETQIGISALHMSLCTLPGPIGPELLQRYSSSKTKEAEGREGTQDAELLSSEAVQENFRLFPDHEILSTGEKYPKSNKHDSNTDWIWVTQSWMLIIPRGVWQIVWHH